MADEQMAVMKLSTIFCPGSMRFALSPPRLPVDGFLAPGCLLFLAVELGLRRFDSGSGPADLLFGSFDLLS